MKRYRITFYILFTIITYFALTPLYVPELPTTIGDKINHMGAFCVLACLLFLGFRYGYKLISLMLLTYGVMIEFIQRMIPGRMFSVEDILADCIGIFAGAVMIFMIKRGWFKRFIRLEE